MLLINFEINLQLNWPAIYFLAAGTVAYQEPLCFLAKTLFSVVTLSTQDNAQFLKQIESGFKITINQNKYQSKITNQAQNQYLDFLIDTSFHRVNGLFVLSFENEDD